MRSSELVGMLWENVRLRADGVEIFLPKSKTDPAGQGSWVMVGETPPAGGRHSGLSPATALRRLRDLCGGDAATGAVFRVSQGGRQALAKGTVTTCVRRALRAAQVPQCERYASHSLRRGGATHAARVGVPTRLIMTLGRWKTDAWRLYTYCEREQLLQAARWVNVDSA